MSSWQVAETINSFNGRVSGAIITDWNIEASESEKKDRWLGLIIHKSFELKQALRLMQEDMILRDGISKSKRQKLFLTYPALYCGNFLL